MKTSIKALVLLLVLAGSALAQGISSVPLKWLSAASNNATLVFGKPTLLNSLVVVNTTSTVYYLHLYNKATAPICGTDFPVWTIPVPGSTTGGYPIQLPAGGVFFSTGLGFCLTGGIADTDNTSAATGVAINMGISGTP